MLPAYDNVMNLEKQCIENSEVTESNICKIEFNNIVNLRDINFSYDNKNPLVKHLNLKIHAGKTTAIVGASGAGKSTIADIVMGLIKPNKGQIKVDNISISQDVMKSWQESNWICSTRYIFIQRNNKI